MDKLLDTLKEWLDGTAQEQSCGYGPDGPHVQVKRPDGDVALLQLRPVAKALVDSMRENERLLEKNNKLNGINTHSAAFAYATMESPRQPPLSGKEKEALSCNHPVSAVADLADRSVPPRLDPYRRKRDETPGFAILVAVESLRA